MSLRVLNKDLLISARDELPPIGEVVVAYQGVKPIFAVRLDANGTPEWFEVAYPPGQIEYRLIEPNEAYIGNWCRIPSVVEA